MFKARYSTQHLAACAMCVLGLGLLVTSDVLSHRYDDADEPKNKGGGGIGVLFVCSVCLSLF